MKSTQKVFVPQYDLAICDVNPLTGRFTLPNTSMLSEPLKRILKPFLNDGDALPVQFQGTHYVAPVELIWYYTEHKQWFVIEKKNTYSPSGKPLHLFWFYRQKLYAFYFPSCSTMPISERIPFANTIFPALRNLHNL